MKNLLQRTPPLLVFLLCSLLAGAVTLPLREKISPPRQDLSQLEGMGQSVLIGTLGGLRALAADFLWLRANYYWQIKNPGLTETTALAVTRLQPDYPYFWIETARIVTFDMPVWRFGRQNPPNSVEQRIRREQAERGLEILEEGKKFLPNDSGIPAEQARIHWIVLQDSDKAQEYYKEAYLKPDQRALYARLRAVLLMDLKRNEEAIEWLEMVLAGMDRERSIAQYDMMVEYLQELRGEISAGDADEFNFLPQIGVDVF